jgi:hypothetical protein
MRRLVLLAVLLLAPLAPAAPRYVALVLYPGQQLTYAAAAPLLTVNAGAQQKRPVTFTFDQYGTRIQLVARTAGTATLLCEYADNHIGEIVSVSVVPRKLYDLHQRTLNALRGVEGLSGDDVMAAGDVVVTGKLYAQGDLERCLSLERETARDTPHVVCGARLSSASAIVTPGLGYTARANLEAQSDVATFGANGTDALTWTVTVRVGDVPVFRAVSSDRTRVVGTAGRLAHKLNGVIDAWRAQTEQKGTAYPVTFRAKPRADGYEVTALWSFAHGTTGDVLATLSLDDLAPVAAGAGVTPDRLVQWWLALLEDAFRLYFMAERPVRAGANATSSPVLSLYQSALKLRHAELDPHTAPTAVARAWFALRLASGRDPFENLLTTPPPDFVRSAP